MTTDTAPELFPDAPDAPDALTAALLTDGWTYANPIRTERRWRSQIHELQNPDGRLYLDAAFYPDGHHTASLSAKAERPGYEHGSAWWRADLHQVALPVALAAVQAAADTARHPAPVEVSAALAAAGWTQYPDVTDRGRLVGREWVSADGERSVRWSTADHLDDGGWTVSRPAADGEDEGAEIAISQDTPAAVITALALTD